MEQAALLFPVANTTLRLPPAILPPTHRTISTPSVLTPPDLASSSPLSAEARQLSDASSVAADS